MTCCFALKGPVHVCGGVRVHGVGHASLLRQRWECQHGLLEVQGTDPLQQEKNLLLVGEGCKIQGEGGSIRGEGVILLVMVQDFPQVLLQTHQSI